MHSVLVADDNKNWLDILELATNMEPEFQVIAKAHNGKDALRLINLTRPDIIILDIIMPEFDGAYIVNYIRNHMSDYDPIIYILSGIGTDTIIKVLNDLEVDFYSMKPVALEVVVTYLKDIVNRRNKEISEGVRFHKTRHAFNLSADHPYSGPRVAAIEDQVKELTNLLGMSPHLLSTKCAADSIVYYVNHPDCVRLLSKVLYPKIAEERGISASSVEKNLRNAIAHMQKSNSDLYRRVFSYKSDCKISNGEFLAVISDFIRRQADF